MPSSLLTWSTIKALPTVSASGVPAVITSLLAGASTVAAAADFPWQVCSQDDSPATHSYIAFKRKSGAPGRIVFGLNKTTASFNPSVALGAGTATANSAYAFYIEGATSDTPTNIKGSGQIFVNEDLVNSTPLIVSVGLSDAAGTSPAIVANEDSIWIMSGRYNNPNNSRLIALLAAGKILVSDDDIAYNAVYAATSTTPGIAAPTAAINLTTPGCQHRRTPTGELEQWAQDLLPDTSPGSLLRDNATKRMWFAPMNLGSSKAIDPTRINYYTLRQIGAGPTPLADLEQIRDGAGNLIAQCQTGAGAGNFCPWFCNFKLNV